MNTVVKFYKEHIKTVAAWVGGVIVTMVMNLVNGVSPWPQTSAQWLQYALTSFGAALAVWIAPTNKITQKQLDKDPDVIGGTVVDGQAPPPVAAPPVSGGRYPSSWQ